MDVEFQTIWRRLYFVGIVLSLVIMILGCTNEKNYIPMESDSVGGQGGRGQGLVVGVKEELDLNPALKSTSSSKKAKAERLALSAEKLVTPIGFMYAYRVFTKALEIDPNNGRARFYQAFLRPAMELRGLITRVEPLVKRLDARAQKRFYDFRDKMAEGGLKEFLLAGQPDISNEIESQNWVKGVYQAQTEFRQFLRENKDLVFDITMNKTEQGNKVYERCAVIEVEPNVFQLPKCPYITELKKSINRADLEVFQQATAGLQIYFMMMTGYDYTGAIDTDQLQKKEDWDSIQVNEYLKTLEGWGDLRKDHDFADFKGLGVDLLGGIKWAYRLKKVLCPKGASNVDNRPGYLFDYGLCIREKVDREGPYEKVETIFAMFEIALSGVAQSTQYFTHRGEGGRKHYFTTDVNFFAPYLNPIKSAKGYLVKSYDECERPLETMDPTVGGMYPKGDAKDLVVARYSIFDYEEDYWECEKHWRAKGLIQEVNP